MIIVRELSGRIMAPLMGFRVVRESMLFRVVALMEDKGSEQWDFDYPLAVGFRFEKQAYEVLDWIFERMKAQRRNPNIIIDMKECPYLKEAHR
ncbi:hypothetical protein [uncultured Dialister sp.]|uniref:hypothetical protein n=1 Tax=uncultured Dialister sp. TaxID=278064 RepID=UPI00204D50C4|nr:hypothetical protein [uncultured Dialister sp.]DAE67661.1 MAG TPA: hypothetical protein [Caudoviricetes sp.]